MKTDTRNKMLASHMATVEELVSKLEDLHGTLSSDYEDHSESWKNSDKGEAENERVETLQSAIDALGEVKEHLENSQVDE